MIFNIITLVYAGTFYLISLTFIIVGINFYRKYKKFSEPQARQIRSRIIISITVISFSFIARGTLNILYYVIDKNSQLRRDWLKNNCVWFPLVMTTYFVIAEILPTLYLCLGLKVATNEAEKRESVEGEIENEVPIDKRFTTINFKERLHSEDSIDVESSMESIDSK
mmetsp:Transcript_17849/g.17574  ORF Transcript_17849/g.17574 Transcript_17849/m.17574 type:complete len:167 (-) Transcript_17849:37-537(-)